MADDPKPDSDVADAQAEFKRCEETFGENYKDALDDLEFARLGRQWPMQIQRERELANRPCLTVNRLPAFIRQVVNDARQNRPAITVHPVDSNADVTTALIMDGLIRHIEQSSDADVAYDTALDFAASCGFGYFGINTRYATDDGFEQDICLERKANPLAIFGDPDSTAADSSDWNIAFELETLPEDAFKKRWKGADAVSFEKTSATNSDQPGEMITLACQWKREASVKQIVAVSPFDQSADPEKLAAAKKLFDPNRLIIDVAVYEANKDLFDAIGAKPQGPTRDVPSHKVTRCIYSGAEELERLDWAGTYIPIVPVYGEELHVEGRRYFRSLIRDVKDPQRMLNYWRPLSLDTPLPTPTGWTTMGAVQIGDQVFDDRGRPCNVIGKSPVHINRDCYRVTFDDGSSIVADACHPWVVEERVYEHRTKWRSATVTTEELTPRKHFIATPGALECETADLPIHPYVLGVWLGDGDNRGGRITPGDEDLDEIVSSIEACGYACNVVAGSGGRCATIRVFGLTGALKAAGLLFNKHIPAAYLRASVEQRRALLRGLMDTDGSVNQITRACDFTTTSPAIAAGLEELLRSLGIKSKSLTRAGRASKVVNGRNGLKDFWQFTFSAYADEAVVGLARKRAILAGRPTEHRRRTKRFAIRSVERVPSVPVQCIAIDAPSHLFLAGESMVPTHNTASTELVALAPKAPFIGPLGTFATDAAKWATANTETHAYIEYDPVPGGAPPERQTFAGPPAGAIQEAINASDDIKSILGMFDASLGAPSNETSGRAILARQKEGDVSTFHIIDNLSRAIRHGGRIILDLIPKVYNTPRMIRILGADGKALSVQLGQQPPLVTSNQTALPPAVQPQANPLTLEEAATARVYDLTLGKYDLTVTAGPSFTTRREEAANQMIELIRAYPQVAPVIGDLLAKNLDWPGADEIADRLHKLLPPQLQGDNPVVDQLQAQLKAMAQALGQTKAQLAEAVLDRSIEQGRLKVEEYDAETARLKAIAPKGVPIMDPQAMAQVQQMILATLGQLLNDPDLLAQTLQQPPLGNGTDAPAPMPPGSMGPPLAA